MKNTAMILYQDLGYDASGNIDAIIIDPTDNMMRKSYSYDGKNQLKRSRQPGKFQEKESTDGIAAVIESDHERSKPISYSAPQNKIFTDSLNKAVEVTFEYGAAVTELRFESIPIMQKEDLAVYTTDREDEPYRLLEVVRSHSGAVYQRRPGEGWDELVCLLRE